MARTLSREERKEMKAALLRRVEGRGKTFSILDFEEDVKSLGPLGEGEDEVTLVDAVDLVAVVYAGFGSNVVTAQSPVIAGIISCVARYHIMRGLGGGM